MEKTSYEQELEKTNAALQRQLAEHSGNYSAGPDSPEQRMQKSDAKERLQQEQWRAEDQDRLRGFENEDKKRIASWEPKKSFLQSAKDSLKGGAAAGAATRSIATIGSDSAKVFTFFVLSFIIIFSNAFYFQGIVFYMLIFTLLLTFLAWFMLYDAEGLNTLAFCFVISLITTLQPVIAVYFQSSSSLISTIIILSPAWLLITMYIVKKKNWFITFIGIAYIALWIILATPSVSNAASKLLDSETLPFPTTAELAGTKASTAAVLKSSWKEVSGLPGKIAKQIGEEIYYAEHGYYRGETAQDVKYVGVKMNDPPVDNTLEYDDPDKYAKYFGDGSSKVPIEITARLKANSKRRMTVSLSCYSKYIDCGQKTCDTEVPESIAPKKFDNVFSKNLDVTCRPLLSPSQKGDYEIGIVASVEKFQEQATLKEQFVSADSLNSRLEQYMETHDVIGEAERETVIAQLYNVPSAPLSVSEPGPLKIIITGSEQPVVGAESDPKNAEYSQFPLIIALERSESDDGNIEKINSLIIELPPGIEVADRIVLEPGTAAAASKEVLNLPSTGKAASSASSSSISGTAGKDSASGLDPCPAFEKGNDLTGSDFVKFSGGTVLKLKSQYKSGFVDFEDREQQSFPRCMLKVGNSKLLLINPERPNPATFRVIADFDYKVKKTFEVEWGQKVFTSSSSGGEACSDVDGLDNDKYPSKTPSAAVEDSVNKYNSEIEAASKRGVCTALIKGIITQESQGNPNVVSTKGAQGLMQLMPGTAKDLGLSGSDVFDPAKNIDAGTRYYKQQLDEFQEADIAAAAYNAGPGNIVNNQIPSYKETQDYVRNVIGYAKYYSSLASITGGSGTFSGGKFDRMPVDQAPIQLNSCFGKRNRDDNWHDGIDINVPTGTPIKSVAPGTVYSTGTGDNSGFGGSVVVKHNDNLYTRYSHLSRVSVSLGQSISEGTVIGLSGGAKSDPNAGSSDGPHLDFKVYTSSNVGGNAGVNPFCYLPFDKTGKMFTDIAESCKSGSAKSTCT